MIRRRSILTGMAGILAAGFAPAAVGSRVLMPVRSFTPVLDAEATVRRDLVDALHLRMFEEANRECMAKLMGGPVVTFDAGRTWWLVDQIKAAEACLSRLEIARVLPPGWPTAALKDRGSPQNSLRPEG